MKKDDKGRTIESGDISTDNASKNRLNSDVSILGLVR